MRKTISVSTIKRIANALLANAELSDDYRMATANMLEFVLIESGNYKGFRYLDVDFSQDPPFIPNESRRYYH